MDFKKLILGIDIGTSSVKVSLLDSCTSKSIYAKSVPTMAKINPSHQKGDEQDVVNILKAMKQCLKSPGKIMEKVKAIGICGQMHGIVFWDEKFVLNFWDSEFISKTDTFVSNLYTWQDARTDFQFLAKLPKPHSHLKAYSGYGCNTIFWLKENQPEILSNFNQCGTIQDLIVSILCNQGKSVMSTHNAASWGYFNVTDCSWNIDILTEANFPVHLLPSVVQPGINVGTLYETIYNIPKGAVVGVALGDLQCSVMATLTTMTDAVINISTSAQVAFIAKEIETQCDSVEYFPYFENHFLAVAASLNGGNVLDSFVRSVFSWVSALGLTITEDELWNRLLHLSPEENLTPLIVNPLIFGERHNPTTYGSLINVTNNNLTLSELFSGFCKGIINNLHKMMPREMLLKAGIQRIIGSGSVITKNHIIKKEIETCYNLPLCVTMSEDSAFGAALALLKNNPSLFN
ncbi:sedoheptulokinase isoform X1 [Acyrthosiphon pisum]|uniref:Sedoheptulokinase n=3 Tax=Acyrthosiphon pisum TaxID=7029 RepID=A0A8R2D2I1_ACYPI|nr:sedoheptulokinase isoform X1 [Acyrthosiphon pisum]XP_016656553.1 sedoheptulokinase isoform X1 [Acyrthosiphon pisum]|eukprot:XP_001952623.3 PREDICTED: sedoheptulokinase isoform X1 [Acyrthosiphon pisum]